MRFADPELGNGSAAPWDQLLDTIPTTHVAAPLTIMEEEDETPVVATVVTQSETSSTVRTVVAQKQPPLRRRHTFADTLSFTLQPLLPRRLLHNEKPVAAESPPTFRYRRQSRFSSRRIRRRVVFKQGECNVMQANVAKRHRRYLQDIFTTLVDAQWRWTLLVFALNFVLSWLAFALVWYAIAAAHGDLNSKTNDRGEVPSSSSSSNSSSSSSSPHKPCVIGLDSFAASFLFSVETQHTIGYGSRSTTEECPLAVLVMCIQCITGVMIQAFMVGIVFAKLSRPKKRTQTLLFSRNAVICQRDSQLCLIFRVGDMRRSHIIEAHVRAQLIRQKITKEGEVIPFYQHELKVGGDGAEDDRIFFIWPTTIVHKIDQDSPLYRLSAADMMRDRFELVVILEGVVESTGMTTQARSSYLPSEILWGHRFEPLMSFRKERGEYEVDYSRFNNTYEVETPLCSAEALDKLRKYSSAIQTPALVVDTPCSEDGDQRRLPPPPSHPPSPASDDPADDDEPLTMKLPGPESRI